MHGDRPRQHCGGKLPPQHIFKSEHGIVGSGDGHDRERSGQGSHCGAVAEYLHVHDVASAAFRQQEIRGHGGEHHGYSSQEKQLEEDYGKEIIEDSGLAVDKITLKKDEYFVLGDNRNGSIDSRRTDIGAVKREQIKGKAWLCFYPFTKFGTIK